MGCKGGEALQLVLPLWRACRVLQVMKELLTLQEQQVHCTITVCMDYCFTDTHAALTTRRPATVGWRPALCCASFFSSSICGATGDVVRNFNLSCVYLAVQVLSLGHGTVSPQDEEKCHWQVLFLQVSTLSQEYRA